MEGKMKKIKVLVLAVMVLGIFQSILYAGISSRVQGNVVDDQTGLPIEGVLVRLNIGGNLLPHIDLLNWETKTDKKGYFKFDLEPDEISGLVVIYLECEKNGYIRFLPKYYRQYIKMDFFDEIYRVFRLKEGQVKHFNIRLKKGGIIEGTLFKKTSAGTSPLGKSTGALMVLKEKFHSFFKDDNLYFTLHYKTDENGKFRIEGIEPFDKYTLSINSFGYRDFEIENISVQNGQITPLEYTCDMTDQTGIEGIVRVSGKTLWGGTVGIDSDFNNSEGRRFSYLFYFSKNGHYKHLGLIPGIYVISISVTTEDLNNFKKEIKIEIQPGITKKLDIDF